jgi:hypothetical protein
MWNELRENRCIKSLAGKSIRKRPLGIVGVNGSIILKSIFKSEIWTWTGFIWLVIGQFVGCYVFGKSDTCSIKCGEYRD